KFGAGNPGGFHHILMPELVRKFVVHGAFTQHEVALVEQFADVVVTGILLIARIHDVWKRIFVGGDQKLRIAFVFIRFQVFDVIFFLVLNGLTDDGARFRIVIGDFDRRKFNRQRLQRNHEVTAIQKYLFFLVTVINQSHGFLSRRNQKNTVL